MAADMTESAETEDATNKGLCDMYNKQVKFLTKDNDENENDDDTENRPPIKGASHSSASSVAGRAAAIAITPISVANNANSSNACRILNSSILNRFRLRKSPSSLVLPLSSKKMRCPGTDDDDCGGSATEHIPSLPLKLSSRKSKSDLSGGGALKRFSRISSYELLDNESCTGTLSKESIVSSYSSYQQDSGDILPPLSPTATPISALVELSYASPLPSEIPSVSSASTSPSLQDTMPTLPLSLSAALSPSPSTPGASGPIMISVMARNNMDIRHSQAKKAKKRKIIGKDKCCRELINDNSSSNKRNLSSRDSSDEGSSSNKICGKLRGTKETANDGTLLQLLSVSSDTSQHKFATIQIPLRARISLETVIMRRSLDASFVSNLSTPSPSSSPSPSPPNLSKLAINSPPSSSSSSPNENKMKDDDEDEDEDEISDDDGDNESTDSNVADGLPPIGSMPQPLNMSMEDQARFYWDLCYGKSGRSRVASAAPVMENTQFQTRSWSASRAGPTRSCFSSKKVSWSAIPSNAKATKSPSTPTLCDRFNFDKNGNAGGISTPFDPSLALTPAKPPTTTFRTVAMRTPDQSPSIIIRNVKFGSPKAAEFDKTRPAAELTPLPSELARERFPIHMESESDDSSEETHREAARNAAVLAEWEKDFDSYIDDAIDSDDNEDDSIILNNDDDVEEENPSAMAQEKQGIRLPASPHRNKKKKGKRDSSNSRNNRRSSGFFSRAVGVSLLDGDHTVRESKANIFSPKRLEQRDDYDNKLSSTVDAGVGEGLPEGCLSDLARSPCFRSPLSMAAHPSSAMNESKETPTLEMRSSSSVLQGVHSAGGAGMEDFNINRPSNKKDCRREIKPSQLDSMLQNVEDDEALFSEEGCDKVDPNIIISTLIEKPNLSASWDTECFFRSMMKNGSSAIFKNFIQRAIDGMYEFDRHTRAVGTCLFQKCSLPACSRTIDMLPARSFPSSSACPGFGRQDVSEIFTKAVSVLEQQINVHKTPLLSESCQTSNEMFSQRFTDFDFRKIYCSLGQLAFNDWQHIETEALSLANNWLMPLIEENRASERSFKIQVEKLRSAMRVAKNKVPDCLVENRNLRRKLKEAQMETTRRKLREEQLAIKTLEEEVEVAERRLEDLRQEQYRLFAKCELEINAPHLVVNCLALCSILPFEPSKLSHKTVSIVHLHLDGTRTILEWNSTVGNPNLERKNGGSPDNSLYSNDSTEGILSEPPHVYRTDATTLITGESLFGKIPFPRPKALTICEDCAAFELYKALLDGNLVRDTIDCLWRYAPEHAVLTASDVLYRIDLVARDVLILQKYYDCRVEIPLRMDFVELWVTISVGGTCSLGVRFTYDRSDMRSVLYSTPSKVFVKAITGEPAVPLTNLQQVGEVVMNKNLLCNAFILKKICTAMIETLLDPFI